MKKAIFWVVLMLIWIPQPSVADTIYRWKDHNGITNFSNEPPPESVTDYQTIDGHKSKSNDSNSDYRRRADYDQMVKRASKEAQASEQQRKHAAAVKEAERQRSLKAQQTAQHHAERKRLESQIGDIQKRAVSPTFPNGMKQAQIEALLKKIEALKKQTQKAHGQ